MKAAIYVRQSLAKDGDELGIQRQEAECRRLCEMRGYTVIEVVTDNNRSATTGDRPGYDRILSMIERRDVDVVVVLRVDRLLRRLTDLEHLINLIERTNAQIVTVSGDLDLSNAQGRLVGRLLASVARAEAEIKGERHVLANRQKAAAGKPHGSRRPFGYMDNQLDLYEPEASILREMADLVLKGWSFKEVAWHLNEAGYGTTTGKFFYPVTIRNMLRKPRYGGLRVYNGETYQGIWTPVFTSEEWEQLQYVLTRRSKTGKLGRKYLLTGLLYCGNCGTPLNGGNVTDSWDSKRNRPRKGGRAYHCRSQGDATRNHGCGKLRRNADALEHFIRECVIYRLDTPELATLLHGSPDSDTELRELIREQKRQRDRLDALVDDYATGLLTKDQLERAKRTASAHLTEIDKRIEKLHRERLKLNVPADQTIRDAWMSQPDGWRRELLDILIKRIIVNPGTSKPFYDVNGVRMRFDPSLIDIEWLI